MIGEYVAAVRRQFDPRDTVLVTELGNPRSYPWFRHVMYYLPEYTTYHLRLGEAAPGYLASPGLSSMAAVAEWRLPLPRRLAGSSGSWTSGTRGFRSRLRSRSARCRTAGRSTCCRSVGARLTMPATSWSP